MAEVRITAEQRKAFGDMLERHSSRINNSRRIESYSGRDTEEEELKKLFGVSAVEEELEAEKKRLQAKIDTLMRSVEAEISKRDAQFRKQNQKRKKEVALAQSELWACTTAEEAKAIVQKYVSDEYPDAE